MAEPRNITQFYFGLKAENQTFSISPHCPEPGTSSPSADGRIYGTPRQSPRGILLIKGKDIQVIIGTY